MKDFFALFTLGVVLFGILGVVGTVYFCFKQDKKWITSFGITLLCTILFPICVSLFNFYSSSSPTSPSSTTTSQGSSSTSVVTNKTVDLLERDPDKYKGRYVELTGEVFNVSSTGFFKKTPFFQMRAYYKNNNKEYDVSLVVTYEETGKPIRNGDYVRVKGYVEGSFSGQNAMGATRSVPQVKLAMLDKITAEEVFAPTKVKKEINKSGTEKGVTITIKTIEFADEETRVYFTLKNEGQGRVILWDSETAVIQAGTIYETQSSLSYKIKNNNLKTETPVNAASDGMLRFPALNPDDKDIKFICKGNVLGGFYAPILLSIDVTWK